MSEFVYYNKINLDFPLNEEITVSSNVEELKSKRFLISNNGEVNSEVYTKDVDFYLNNTQDSIADKIINVHKLYEIAATKYDYAQDISYSANIENKVLLVATEDEAKTFMSNIDKDEFDLYYIQSDSIKSIEGHIGNLTVVVDKNNKDITVQIDQIVWFDAQELGLKQSGIFDPLQSSLKEVLSTVRANIESFEYTKFTTYDSTICQYHERREEICSKCEEVCPTVAILKDDEKKHLEFSQIDCHGCGGCISVCPSGALDYAASNKEALFEMSKFYKETHPLIIPSKMDIENLQVELKENVLPFSIDGEKFLHESTLLTLAQISASQIVFYTDFISKGTGDAIRILNDIYQKKYGKDVILVAQDKEQLQEALEKVSFIEDSYYNLAQESFSKREIFSLRLKHIVGDENLGVVQTGEHIHYAKVKVNEANCTLCLVCVGACNVNALQAEAKDNTLRLNPSLCTSCGYCEVSCPEADCLTIERDIIELEPNWFKENILAKDELFACVECGKEFATVKSIQKIATMMSPIFSSDPVKERSLYCCADCKPKIMMQSYYDKKSQGAVDA
ncbi:MAG: 4Fe-4S binding protein [Arcobacteraceae bacterium]|nr:4Fe-4S binding protein [Arcobacteraceae bacterium]